MTIMLRLKLLSILLLLIIRLQHCFIRSTLTSNSCRFNSSKLKKTLQNASVVISATVLRITVDPRNDQLQTATVKVKRIFKGFDIINGRKKIAVNGLGNVQICHSTLYERETKIIVLNELNGLFYLNSSLIPINLDILDQFNAYFKGQKYIKRKRIKKLKCEEMKCPYGAKCRPYSGVCECRTTCSRTGPVVCGTDDVSYLSECHLSVRSCLAHEVGKREIRVKRIGACEKRNPCEDLRCGPGEQCVISEDGQGYISAHCVCPQECVNYGDSIESSPVCSNDGIDFASLCHLRAHACKTKQNESVKYYGKCDPCNDHVCLPGTVCKVSVDRRAECRCSQQCTMHSDPVCATDGNTYENECLMSVSACRQDIEIQVYNKGHCKEDNPCKLIQCWSGGNCYIQENGTAVCKCKEYCSPVMKPVCAIDGKTYDNECEMQRLACLLKIHNAVRHVGICDLGVCAGYDGCQPPKVCIDQGGRPTCECETCNSQLSEICASDGITYANECKMRLESCLTGKYIYQKYNGICDGCVNVHCEFYAVCVSDESGTGSCQCLNQCADNGDSEAVCATDGITYRSECHMRLAACQQQKFIVVAFRGSCDSCWNGICYDGRRCDGDICSCLTNCLDATDNRTVCGNDGILYPSKCHLEIASCRKGSIITTQNLSYCQQPTRKFQECVCNRVGSYNNVCDEHGQCRCLPGVGGKQCDHCMSGFWGLHLIAKGALGCQPCGCSVFGSSRLDCEQSTARCQCRAGSYGAKCDSCSPGFIMTPSGCAKSADYREPKNCNEMSCHHGAVCISGRSGIPDCECPKVCPVENLGLIAGIAVCGSDGTTYSSMCELWQIACSHQLDLVPASFGICPLDSTYDDTQGRRGRKLNLVPTLGNLCADDSDCHIFNAHCSNLNKLSLRTCECREGFFPSKDMTKCLQG